eukprot:scaffold228179_cov15-Tisochrysis_lutea.AAC.1
MCSREPQLAAKTSTCSRESAHARRLQHVAVMHLWAFWRCPRSSMTSCNRSAPALAAPAPGPLLAGVVSGGAPAAAALPTALMVPLSSGHMPRTTLPTLPLFLLLLCSPAFVTAAVLPHWASAPASTPRPLLLCPLCVLAFTAPAAATTAAAAALAIHSRYVGSRYVGSSCTTLRLAGAAGGCACACFLCRSSDCSALLLGCACSLLVCSDSTTGNKSIYLFPGRCVGGSSMLGAQCAWGGRGAHTGSLGSSSPLPSWHSV